MKKAYTKDGRLARLMKICLALPEAIQESAGRPAKFYMPAYIGPRGWVALRLDVSGLDWNEVAELVVGSYKLIAPKRLALLANSDRAKEAVVSSSVRTGPRPRTGPPARKNEPRRMRSGPVKKSHD